MVGINCNDKKSYPMIISCGDMLSILFTIHSYLGLQG